MCGIVGYIGRTRHDEAQIRQTLTLMKNRGPDGQAYVQLEAKNSWCSMLHSRLAIIDLHDRANQPFRLGSLTLIFNGEIYNYQELRRKLSQRGVSFQTSSDTEVLIHMYANYGAECVQHLEGMWAFAIYDSRDNTVFLSRDRFGEKPLYYHQDSTGIYWGSEIKFLSKLSGKKFSINYEHLRRYIALGYKSLYKTTATFFDGISELPAGTSAVLSASALPVLTRYWNPNIKIDQSLTTDRAIEATRSALADSLRLRLRSDVPLAFCLSGGVDSAGVVSIATKVFNVDAHTFSIVDPDERYNEEENIRATISDLGCGHTIIHLENRDNYDRLQDLIAYHDSPILTPSYLIHSMLSEQIHARGFKVAFSGTSADELFTGYYDHFLLHLYEVRHESDFADHVRNWQQHTGNFVRNPLLKDPELYIKDPNFREHVFDNYQTFNSYLYEPFVSPYSEIRYHDSLLRNRMLNELFHEATPVILHEDDLNSMKYSIENRSPYLDTRLFELAYSIPASLLIQDGHGKYILRQALRGILNDKVRLDRRKKGFNASINSLFDLHDTSIRNRFLDPSHAIYKIVKFEKIAPLFESKHNANPESKFLFSLMNAMIFMDQN